MRNLEAYRQLFSPPSLGQLVIAFNGCFSQSNIVSLGESIRNTVNERKNPVCARKAFSIFVEMSQNVMRYSIEKDAKHQGKGQFLLFYEHEAFYLITSNLVEPGQLDFLKKRIGEVNRLSPRELSSTYLVRQRQKTVRESGGAGLGLLDMVRRSGYPLGHGFLPEGEGRLRFFLRATIK